jgi:predicted nucleic acid-binding protein
MKLFDSSAIINICRENRVDKLTNGCTLDLAFYELGNTVWKMTYLRKAMSIEEAIIVLNALIEVYGRMKGLRNRDVRTTLEIALKEGLTFYDASYIKVALENNLDLVTDDERLYRAASKYVKTFKSSEL